MVRGLALTALTGGFLFISPKLRDTVWDFVGGGVNLLERYSPISYVGLVVLTVIGFLAFVSTASDSR